MLYVTYQQSNGIVQQKLWHLGDSKEITFDYPILEIFANGVELIHIRNYIKNIPYAEGSTTYWKAPFAQFIWDNL